MTKLPEKKTVDGIIYDLWVTDAGTFIAVPENEHPHGLRDDHIVRAPSMKALYAKLSGKVREEKLEIKVLRVDPDDGYGKLTIEPVTLTGIHGRTTQVTRILRGRETTVGNYECRHLIRLLSKDEEAKLRASFKALHIATKQYEDLLESFEVDSRQLVTEARAKQQAKKKES